MGAAGLALGRLVEVYARDRSAEGRRDKQMMEQRAARNLATNARFRERMEQGRS